jgi:hypothetical protein
MERFLDLTVSLGLQCPPIGNGVGNIATVVKLSIGIPGYSMVATKVFFDRGLPLKEISVDPRNGALNAGGGGVSLGAMRVPHKQDRDLVDKVGSNMARNWFDLGSSEMILDVRRYVFS